MYESIMWKYMGEEKTLLNALITNETEKEKIHKIDRMKALYCVAHGSSYNAAMSIAPFITELSGVRTYVYTPSNFRFNALSIKEEDKEDTWVLGISQTGTSRGVLEALEQAKNDGFRILGITNVEGSPIDKLSDVCLYLHCGEEDSNAKTKGYSSTLVLLMMLGIEMGKDVDKDEYYAQLKEEIDHLDDVRNATVKWCEDHKYGVGMKNLYVVGNGMNFASAMEGQLKVMETMCIPTMFNDIEEFSHGMHRSLNGGCNVILIDAGADSELVTKTKEYLDGKNIPVLVLNGQDAVRDDKVINLGKYEKTASLLSVISAIQAISAFIPEINGLDPNRNANNDYTDCVETRV